MSTATSRSRLRESLLAFLTGIVSYTEQRKQYVGRRDGRQPLLYITVRYGVINMSNDCLKDVR